MGVFIKPSFEPTESCFWRKPKLISADMEDHVKNNVIRAMHVHDDRVEIILVRNGNGVHTINSKSYATKAGDILIYNAGDVHDECADSKDGMDILWCTVSNIKIGDERDNVLIPQGYPRVLQQAKCYHEAEALAIMLISEKQPEIQHHILCAFLLMLREEALARGLEKQDKRMQLGHAVQRYLDQNYLEDIHLQDIADEFHMNAEYLSRAFRRTVGYSPMQYVTRRRIGQAQSWLIMTDKMVTEIAFLVGYNSVGNFHAAFLKTVGMTPQKYREHCNE